MENKEFDEFLRRQDEKSESSVNWEQEKYLWLQQIDTFYSYIKRWLKEYVDTKRIIVQSNQIEITEEYIGTYNVEEVKIIIGNKIATLTPKGTLMIGTRGRIDMTGRSETIRFVLADKNSEGPKIEITEYSSEYEKEQKELNDKKRAKPKTQWIWKISSDPPNISYTELNRESFLKSLMKVLDE